MKKLSVIVSLVIILLLFENKLICLDGLSVNNIYDIILFSEKVMNMSRNIKSEVDVQSGNNYKSLPTEHKVQTMRKLSQQISELTEEMEIEMSSLFITIVHSIPIAGDIKSVIREFYNWVIRIEELYRIYKDYTRTTGPDMFENHSIHHLVETVTSLKYGDLSDMLYHVWRIFVPTQFSVIQFGILDYVIQHQVAADPRIICSNHVSFQYTLKEYFNSAVTSEIKGFILRAFSYGVLPGSFISELKKAQTELIIKSNEYLETTRHAMQSVPRDLHRCDPPKYTWNETYAELEFLFQKIVVNEIQVFPAATCSLDCYQIDSNYIHRCYSWSAYPSRRRTYCPKRYCRGRMHRCSWVGSVTLCELPFESHRRYEWIQSENGRYGSYSEECDGYRKRVNKSMSGFYNCDNCLCDCVEERADSEATRTISLMPQMSNVEENMVITGVRFILKNSVLHIQIEEATLLPKGRIDNHNRSWVYIENWEYLSNVSRGGFNMIKNNETITLKNEEDFSFIRSDQKIMHLDDITAPRDHIITGVRFNHVWPPWPDQLNDSPLQIEIYVTPYDYDSGLLNLEMSNFSHWVTPQTLYDPPHHYFRDRTEVKIPRPNNPIKAPFNVPDSKPNQFIKFRSSDIWKDAGQSTVPFFDLQPITSLREALDCIGIFHRGAKGYGGFIALKICTLDISTHLQPLSEDDVEAYRSLITNPSYIPQIKHKIV